MATKRKRKVAKRRRGVGAFESGYCYEFEGKRNWRRSSSEKWATEVCDCDNAKRVGSRTIDGSHVTVFKCADGKFRAQTGNR